MKPKPDLSLPAIAALIEVKADSRGTRDKVRMQQEHLDHALEEEFAGHGNTIHKLKVSSPGFRSLLESNHQIWREIQNIQSGVTPASDDRLTMLEKRRLKILDDIASAVAEAEA